MTVLRSTILARLQEQNIRYMEICLDGGATILVTELGGRVFGPFLTPQSESLYWVHPAFSNAVDFKKLIANEWNLGGERLWVGPELQYMVRDRKEYFGSLFFPPDMDLGQWTLTEDGTSRAHLAKDLTLEAYNLARGTKHLRLETEIYPAPDPLRHLGKYAELMSGVVYAGYQQAVSLTETACDDILSNSWNLIQLPPGGEMIIPCSPAVEPRVYKGLLDETVQEVFPDHVRLRITARQMYKSGYPAAHVFGRLGYYRRLSEDSVALIIRDFPNHPSSVYPDEPPDRPGQHGDSIYVYNDDGRFGDFGELECAGQTIGGGTGKSSATDEMSLWLYAGSEAQIRKISVHLLGVLL